MAVKNVLDNYDQFCVLTNQTTAVAAGHLYTKLETGLTNRQTLAWVVSRIVYWVPGTLFQYLTVLGNYMHLGITSMNALTTTSIAGSFIYDELRISSAKVPAGGALEPVYWEEDVVHEFAPGHEPLIIPQNLYLMLGWSFAGAPAVIGVAARIFYREIELGKEDWYDLLQLRTVLGAV